MRITACLCSEGLVDSVQAEVQKVGGGSIQIQQNSLNFKIKPPPPFMGIGGTRR